MRLRAGISLWIVSWLPIAQLLGATEQQRLVIWGIQVVIGIVGLALAGVAFAEAVKLEGWRGAPRVAWRAMLHGTSPRAAVHPASETDEDQPNRDRGVA